MKNANAGFTLIELLIVIAIIGILAAVLIPNLLGARTRAFTAAAQACASSIARGQELYAIDNNGAYSATDSGLEGLQCDNITVTPGADWTGTSWTAVHTGGGSTVNFGPDGIN